MTFAKHAVFVLLGVLCFCDLLHSQAISVVSANVAGSICYNDGSVSLNVTGGSPPYHYAIINGPNLANVNYPILPSSGSTFLSLHSGTYTVRVTDNGADTLLYSITIPGNYRFPVLAANLHIDTIIASAAFGLKPYLFAISTVGPNGPFGAFQTDSVFPNLCNGEYYVRVLDSCGNFFTAPPIVISRPKAVVSGNCSNQAGFSRVSVFIMSNTGHPPYRFTCTTGNYSVSNDSGIFWIPTVYTCPDTVFVIDVCNDTTIQLVDCHPFSINFCSNFSDSSALLTPTGGTGPYTFKFFEEVNGTWILSKVQDSSHFVHLMYRDTNETVAFQAVDACGRASVPFFPADYYMRVSTSDVCPYDSSVRVYLSGAFSPYTITCITCNPQQTLIYPNSLLTGIDTGYYTIRARDACGEVRDKQIHVTYQPLSLHVTYLACNDILVKAFDSNDQEIDSGVIYTIYNVDTVLYSNTSGLFSNLSDGIFTVKAHANGCIDAALGVTAPFFNGYCTIPYFDSTCHLKYLVDYGHRNPDTLENYSLVSSTTGVTYHEAPLGLHNKLYLNIDTGYYTLVSDSGCSVPQNFGYGFQLTYSSEVNCWGQASISLYEQQTGSPPCFLPLYRYTIQNADTLISSPPDSGYYTFNNIAPGFYTLRVYFANQRLLRDSFSIIAADSTCLLDSAHIFIEDYSIPFVNTQNVNVCGDSARGDIPFTINGGFAPYYVSIAGLTDTTVNTTVGVLRNLPVGTYTIIVSDSCGISSSRSVSVADTCNCRTGIARFTVSDTLVCINSTISFYNLDSLAQFYHWKADNISFSNVKNPQLTPDSVGDHLVQCIAGYATCADTFKMVIRVIAPVTFELGNDSLYCDSFSRRLTTGISNTLWSTGVTDSFITVNTAGLYWARITGVCSVFADSVKLQVVSTPAPHINPDTLLCPGDSITLHANSIADTYYWNTGADMESVVIKNEGIYSVTVSSLGCSSGDSLHVMLVHLPDSLLGADTTLCNGDVVVLATSYGINPVWQDGSHSNTFSVSTTGTYFVSVESPCGIISDTVKIDYTICPSSLHVAEAFTPNGDGTNDYFTVFGNDLTEYHIRIYNRWGELVYSSEQVDEVNNLSRGWDGTYKGKLQDVGTFVYYIDAKGEDGKSFFKKGNVTLIR